MHTQTAREEIGPVILPMRPRLLGLSIDYVEVPGFQATYIVRRFDRPEACRLCPGRPCMAMTAGFCSVRVDEIVPRALCPGYLLPSPAG